MRFLRGALVAAVLLGCNEDDGPVQPQLGGEVSALKQSDSAGSDAAVTATDDIRPTRGFYVFGFPSGGTEPIGTVFTEIQRLSSLPAGKYIANASAALASNAPDRLYVDFIFTLNDGLLGELGRGMVGGTGRDDFLSVPLAAGFTLNAPGDLGLSCITSEAGVVFSQSSPITAIRLDRLTVQQP